MIRRDIRVMHRITKKMERNQVCGLFIHALSKDVLGLIRSYMSIRLLRATEIVKGCEAQKLAMAEGGAFEDLYKNELVLPKSGINLPRNHHMYEVFILHLRYGCGTCLACKRKACRECKKKTCVDPDHFIEDTDTHT